jgi:hypothetical protein
MSIAQLCYACVWCTAPAEPAAQEAAQVAKPAQRANEKRANDANETSADEASANETSMLQHHQPVEEKKEEEKEEDKPAEEQNKADSRHSRHSRERDTRLETLSSRDTRHTHTEPPEDKKAASTRDVDAAVAEAAATPVNETPTPQSQAAGMPFSYVFIYMYHHCMSVCIYISLPYFTLVCVSSCYSMCVLILPAVDPAVAAFGEESCQPPHNPLPVEENTADDTQGAERMLSMRSVCLVCVAYAYEAATAKTADDKQAARVLKRRQIGTPRLMHQYMYFCTSTASSLGTFAGCTVY